MDSLETITTRQESLDLHLPKAVAVIGCGGVGSWVAYFLALAGVPEIWIFDNATVSISNLNRLPLSIKSVDKNKAKAMAALIKQIRPECKVLCLGNFSPHVADSLRLQDEVTWVVAATDSLASRQLAYDWARMYRIKYIETAAEGDIGSATGEPASFKTPEDDQPGYASVPVWVGPCVFAAAIAVSHVVHSRRLGDRTIRMGWNPSKDLFDMYDSAEGKNGKT